MRNLPCSCSCCCESCILQVVVIFLWVSTPINSTSLDHSTTISEVGLKPPSAYIDRESRTRVRGPSPQNHRQKKERENA